MATTGQGSTVPNNSINNLFDFQPSVNSVKVPQTQGGAKTLFINEREAVNNMLNAGIPEQEAYNAITEKRKTMLKDITADERNALRNMASDDVDINEAISFVKERRYKNLPLWKKVAKVPFDMSVGATSLVAEQTGNLLDFVTGGKGDFKESVEGIKEVTDRSFSDSKSFQAGRNIMGTGELIAAAPTKLAPTLWGRIAQGAVVGGAVGGIEPILQKGSDATAGDIVGGAALGGTIGAAAGPVFEKGIPLITKTISKAKNFKPTGNIVEGATEKITRDLPESVVRRDLGFTPTESKKVEEILGMSEGRYVLQKGLGGQGKEEMAEFFARNADDQYRNITTKLEKTTDVVESKTANAALEDIITQLKSDPKAANFYKDDIIAAENMLAKGKYNGPELNNIRRAFDKVNNGLYSVSGKPKNDIHSGINIEYRKNLNDEIEEIAEKAGFSVKEMNKELRASLLMKDSLLRRLSQEQKNNFLGLQDLGVSAILSGGNPVQAVAIIGAKKLAEDAAPGLSQKLYNLNTKKDVVSKTVKRGNTINTGNKSSRLGLSSNTGDNVPGKPKQGEGAIKKSERVETEKQLQLKAKKEEKVLSDLKSKLESKKSFYNKSGTAKVKPLAKEIITDLGLDATQAKTALTIIREYIKKFGNDIKNKLGDLVDEIADKVGARSKFIDDSGKGVDDFGVDLDVLTEEGKKIFQRKYDNNMVIKLDDIINNSKREITRSEASNIRDLIKNSGGKINKTTNTLKKGVIDNKIDDLQGAIDEIKNEGEYWDEFDNMLTEDNLPELKQKLKILKQPITKENRIEADFVESKSELENITENITVYRGKSKGQTGFLVEKERGKATTAGGNVYGISTSTNRSIAEDFAMPTGGDVIQFDIEKGAKVLNFEGKGDTFLDSIDEGTLKELHNRGYDAIIDNTNIGGEMEIRILNDDIIIDKDMF